MGEVQARSWMVADAVGLMYCLAKLAAFVWRAMNSL